MLWTLLAAPCLAAPTIAIADLVNNTGDPALDGAGPGVAGILVSRFSQTDAVRVIERDALVKLLDEQRLTEAGLTDPATAARAGKLLGADYLVVGELFSVKLPSISVALRVVDTQTGEVVASRDVVGEVGADGERFFVLVDELSDEILSALDVTLGTADRARLSSIDRRELSAVVRYGDDLTRVSTDNPLALYRQTDHDFSRDAYWRTHWTVYEHDGKEVPMPMFARRVGDEDTNEAYMEHLAALRHRAVRTQLITAGYGLLGVGLMASGGGIGNGDDNRQTPTAVQGIGGTLIFLCPVNLLLNVAGQAAARRSARYPGVYYTPEDADRWIHAYNASLH